MAEGGQREGQQLGNYRLLQLLGRGHRASVYLGEHRHLHTQAAIKVLHDPLATREVEGFLTEARTLARLRHPHIVRILDFGLEEDTPFLVMDYAPGGTLRTLHPHGAQLPLEMVIPYVKQIASALQYAHAQRLIHRDLKPENLLLGPDQEVWLSDFGLAIMAQSSRSQPSQQTAGTLAYMAPEQLKGHPTPASDQYALGVLVYEWLCGECPFAGSFKEHLQQKQLLLLLDNFEHVMSAAMQVAELLAACPKLKIMVTSRMVLHVRAEHEFAVPPLSLPDPVHLPDLVALSQYEAVMLFVARTQAIKADFALSEANARAIAEICARLDGLPLAIELAAARSKLLPPQALLKRLSHRLEILTGGVQDLPARQQTLRNTLAWSYELLTAQEQRLFRRLSVFVGGCTLEAIEAVCAAFDEADRVLEGMASLLDKSLLQQTERGGEEPRFAMLETIREYGLEVLASSREAQVTRQAHAEYYLALAEQAEPQLSGSQQISWFERLEREHDNLRAALSWLLEQSSNGQSKELALRLSGALWRFWEIRGYVSEGRHWLEWALEESRDMRSALRAKALLGAGELATRQDDFDQAEALCREGLALYRELGDRRGCATALSIWGYTTLSRCNYAAAQALLEEALALFTEVGDTGGRSFAVNPLATVLFYQGEYGTSEGAA